MTKYDINYIRGLLLEKEKSISGIEDQEKIDNLKSILENDNIFFMIDVDTAIGILLFLGVLEDKIKDVYFNLTSPKAFKQTNDTYISVGEK